jgi:hypothetical protein
VDERRVVKTMADRLQNAEERASAPGRGAEGFALILAIMALMILTFLGLTLATTTSTELQIATNYRWGQQAFYNAEAGMEVAKSLLRGPDWSTLLPPARSPAWLAGSGSPPAAPLSRSDEWGNGTRNFEMGGCDGRGGQVGYGVVFDDGSAAAPYQYKTTLLGQSVNGAFTLWVRRRLISDPGGFVDSTANDELVIVSEGVAPFTGEQAASAFGVANRSVRVLEFTLGRQPSNQGQCGTRGGQAGGGPDGANFSGCDAVTQAGVTAGLAGIQ